jgi:hypothetical protein
MINAIRLIDDTVRGIRTSAGFTPGELSMLLDIFNSTGLDPISIQHGAGLDLQVRDSFDLYPGMYEEKWKAEKEPFLTKIAALSDWQAACLTIWACDFWTSGTYEEPDAVNRYVTGKAGAAHRLSEALAHALEALKCQEKFKGVGVKSKLIATAQSETAKAAGILKSLVD